MKKSITASIFLHLCFLALFLGTGSGGSGDGTGTEQGGSGSGVDGSRIAEKPVSVVPVTPEIQKEIDKQSKMTINTPKAVKPKIACEHFYGGIGVTFNRIDGTVLEAHPGYPAYKAGITTGDVLYSNEDIRGEPGTVVDISVLRGQKLFSIQIQREKICLED